MLNGLINFSNVKNFLGGRVGGTLNVVSVLLSSIDVELLIIIEPFLDAAVAVDKF